MQVGQWTDAKNVITNFFKNASVLAGGVLTCWFASPFITEYYCRFRESDCVGSWVDFSPLIGLTISYYFFTPFFLSAFSFRGSMAFIIFATTGPYLFFHFYELGTEILIFFLGPLMLGWLLGSVVRFTFRKGFKK